MRVMFRKLNVYFLLPGILAILLTASVQDAAASDRDQCGPQGTTNPCKWHSWLFELDFQGGEIKAHWTTLVGVYDEIDEQKRIIHYRQRYTIDGRCTNHGVRIDEDSAIFNGTSFIRCTTPNHRAIVEELIGGVPDFSLSGEIVPWVAVSATVPATVSTSPNLLMAVRDVARPAPPSPQTDMRFSLPYDDPSCHAVCAHLFLYNPKLQKGIPTWSESFEPDQLVNIWYGKGVRNFVDFYQGSGGFLGDLADQLAHILDSREDIVNSSAVSLINGRFNQIHNGRASNFIGYSPIGDGQAEILIGGNQNAADGRFEGELHHLVLDPAAFSPGCSGCR